MRLSFIPYIMIQLNIEIIFYKLPSESVNEGDKIRIERYDDQLIFYHAGTNELLCKHRLILGKGNGYYFKC